MKKTKRGLLVTFEGIEGSGKTTLLEDVFRSLKKENYNVMKTFEPGSGAFGKKIRGLVMGSGKENVLPETELFLFLADRSQHVKKEIVPALEKKQIVLCDRFTDSTIAYQAYGRNLPLKLLLGINKLATGGLLPDLTLFLDIPVKEGLKRIQKRTTGNRLDKETAGFYEKVRKGYYFQARYNKRIVILDALQDRGHLREKILQEIGKVIQKKLWNS